ncbi:MAG: hflX, partial [Acidobacteria bacterium]|nr:hflX [Acidobacteriota bacterium]
TPRERAALVGLATGRTRREAAERSLEELAGLAKAAGASVVLSGVQERPRPDPATFLGSGKVATLTLACDEADVELVIFDNELSPAQLRNLERSLGRRVIDRTQLILDIFARRARTREGKLQVELAQLEYLLPRLVGFGIELSRLGAGIGTRGPGETKLETDRRKIRQRIATITRQLATVERRRGQLRERRQRLESPSVALVGYTNAGKTTLFNRLTRERAVTSDALFVTLDPLVREARLHDGQRVMLSDTVGFIDRLPHTLVAAFHATLEEVVEADLLLHVVDASSEDGERQAGAVRTVLEEIGASAVPVITVYNKADLLDGAATDRLSRGEDAGVVVSARTGEGLGTLREAMARRLGLELRRVRLEFDAGSERDRARMARLSRLGRVLERRHVGDVVSLDIELPRRVLQQVTAGTS